MKPTLGAAIERASKLTRAQNLAEATRVLMRGLTGAANAAPAPQEAASPEPAPQSAPWIEKFAEGAKSLAGGIAPDVARKALPLGETLERLRKGELPDLGQGMETLARLRKAPQVVVPDGAAWLARTFACEAGTRPYKVYVPARRGDGPRPLVIMLHGCTQSADDFAAGVDMNALAEERGFVVAYPEQVMTANHLGCWNWFNPRDQLRDAGEPSIIAGLTRALIAEMDIDPERVFVAGLSAGGAMAEVMSATYPDLYAGAGVHSGLVYGVASDTASAFAAMSGNAPGRAKRVKERVRTIIFHGGADQKVHPTNGELILAEARAGLSAHHLERTERGNANGRQYSRTVVADMRGVPQVEYWSIEGLGHAWSGGAPAGSHTDPQGPDASREMIRFFLEEANRD